MLTQCFCMGRIALVDDPALGDPCLAAATRRRVGCGDRNDNGAARRWRAARLLAEPLGQLRISLTTVPTDTVPKGGPGWAPGPAKDLPDGCAHRHRTQRWSCHLAAVRLLGRNFFKTRKDLLVERKIFKETQRHEILGTGRKSTNELVWNMIIIIIIIIITIIIIIIIIITYIIKILGYLFEVNKILLVYLENTQAHWPNIFLFWP